MPQMLARELHIAHQRLSHPNIVLCFGVYEETRVWFVMFEYMQEGDLRDWFVAKPIVPGPCLLAL